MRAQIVDIISGVLILSGSFFTIVGMIGLNMVLAGVRRGVKHKVANRREREGELSRR